MKVTLGVPLSHGFPVPSAFVVSYALLQQCILQGLANHLLPEERRIDACRVIWGQDFPTDHARNKICRLFLDQDDGEYLLFLDADMTHPADLAHRLVKHDLDIVSGRYSMRKPPFFSVAMRKVGPGATEYQAIEKLMPLEKIRGLIEIDAAGGGALMIRRRVLEDVRAMNGGVNEWFRYQDGPDGVRSRSEDMWFFEQAKRAGYTSWLDADCRCGHIAQFEIDDRYHKPYADAYQTAVTSAAYEAPEDAMKDTVPAMEGHL